MQEEVHEDNNIGWISLGGAPWNQIENETDVVLTRLGCTNPLACNYDPNATVDNGSCSTSLIGSTCDDLNDQTTNDVIIAGCTCQGTQIANSVEEIGNEFSVFPNPSDGSFAINMKNGESILQLEVFDVSGKRIFSSMPYSSSSSVDLSGFAKGIYFLKIRTNNNSRVIRLERI